MRRFSKEDVATLELMAGCGHTAASIARQLGRDPLAIRAKACALGIKFRRKRPDGGRVRFVTTGETWKRISAEAERRNISASRLCLQLVDIIADDNLFGAIFDGARPRHNPRWRGIKSGRRRRSAAVPRPILAPSLVAHLRPPIILHGRLQ
ncbi:MAG: hypothetical protein WBW73_27355 [Rhodoplanes sp.]